jgi:hypothetical protein
MNDPVQRLRRVFTPVNEVNVFAITHLEWQAND